MDQIDPAYVDSLPIRAVNPQPVQWWQQGIPGYLVNHPLPVGAGVALLGHVTRKRWLRTAGLVVAAWAVADVVMRKRQAGTAATAARTIYIL